jgi:putative restriction endonuclease
MANAVFTTKVNPVYDDLPEIRYHFPKTYLRQAEEAVGDWVLYYEPRREGADLSGRAGRQCYFAMAQVNRIGPDPKRVGFFYAYISDYLEFPNPVPFRSRASYLESALQKADGSTNKGSFGRSVRNIPQEEFTAITRLGLREVEHIAALEPGPMVFAETPVEYGRSMKMELVERPFREAAFTRVVQKAYGGTCAMTGLKLINGGGRCETEAAHIKPVKDNGPDSPRNGIALSRTIHWMFDKHFLSISDSGEILIARDHVPEPVRRLLNPDGKVKVPTSPLWRPHPVFLRYHQALFKGN